MSKEISSKIKLAFEESINLKKIILKDELFTVLEKCGSLIANSISEGGKLMTCGNGGSAADAQHLAAELLVRLTSQVNRKDAQYKWRIICPESRLEDAKAVLQTITCDDPYKSLLRSI